jgi:hypothetical protein
MKAGRKRRRRTVPSPKPDLGRARTDDCFLRDNIASSIDVVPMAVKKIYPVFKLF